MRRCWPRPRKFLSSSDTSAIDAVGRQARADRKLAGRMLLDLTMTITLSGAEPGSVTMSTVLK